MFTAFCSAKTSTQAILASSALYVAALAMAMMFFGCNQKEKEPNDGLRNMMVVREMMEDNAKAGNRLDWKMKRLKHDVKYLENENEAKRKEIMN
jgi:hypothetical protein